MAHDVGDADDGDASQVPAHKKPKVGPTTTMSQEEQPKAQPKAQEEQQPKRKKAKR